MMRNRQSLGAAFLPQQRHQELKQGGSASSTNWRIQEGEKWVVIISEEHAAAPNHSTWLFPNVTNQNRAKAVQSRPGSARV